MLSGLYGEVPTSINTFIKIVRNFAASKRSVYIKSIKELKSNNRKFTVSFDEWSAKVAESIWVTKLKTIFM